MIVDGSYNMIITSNESSCRYFSILICVLRFSQFFNNIIQRSASAEQHPQQLNQGGYDSDDYADFDCSRQCQNDADQNEKHH